MDEIQARLGRGRVGQEAMRRAQEDMFLDHSPTVSGIRPGQHDPLDNQAYSDEGSQSYPDMYPYPAPNPSQNQSQASPPAGQTEAHGSRPPGGGRAPGGHYITGQGTSSYPGAPSSFSTAYPSDNAPVLSGSVTARSSSSGPSGQYASDPRASVSRGQTAGSRGPTYYQRPATGARPSPAQRGSSGSSAQSRPPGAQQAGGGALRRPQYLTGGSSSPGRSTTGRSTTSGGGAGPGRRSSASPGRSTSGASGRRHGGGEGEDGGRSGAKGGGERVAPWQAPRPWGGTGGSVSPRRSGSPGYSSGPSDSDGARRNREQKALARAAEEARVRADTWMALKAEMDRKKGAGDGTEGLDMGGSGAAAGTTAGSIQGKASRMNVEVRRRLLVDRNDAPVQYIESRHMQAEDQARRIVEEALLQQGLGLDAYKYMEG